MQVFLSNNPYAVTGKYTIFVVGSPGGYDEKDDEDDEGASQGVTV